MIHRVNLGGCLDLDGAGGTLVGGQYAKRLQPLREHRTHDRAIVMVAVSEELAVGGEDVDALASRAPLAPLWALIGDRAEKLAFIILAATLVPVVGGDRHEILLGHLENRGIGKGEHTA